MIPVYKELADLSEKMQSGNFSLWYNKFIPVDNKFKPYPLNEEVSFYQKQYNNTVLRDQIKLMLQQKHIDQLGFYKSLANEYKAIIFTAILISPLVTGIGESHPHEISMVFDHNIGIPYIPASSVKGIVRLSHILNKIDEDETLKQQEIIDLDDDRLRMKEIFGNENRRGSVIFLDSYPLSLPELRIDILNPHYGDYYGDKKYRTPPADYLQPVPVKFLTVKEKTKFVFRCLIKNTERQQVDLLINGIKTALEREGVGAKTSLGYGRFTITEGEPDEIRQMVLNICLLYTSPSPRDLSTSRMPSSA